MFIIWVYVRKGITQGELGNWALQKLALSLGELSRLPMVNALMPVLIRRLPGCEGEVCTSHYCGAVNQTSKN